MDMAAMVFDDAVGNGESQACPLADVFRGEEGVKNLFLGFLAHPAAIVCKTDLNLGL